MSDATLLLVVLAGLLGLIPARIASRKGRSFAVWWIFGLLFWIIAFPASILVSDARPRCPRCAEPVRAEAAGCPHCGQEMPDGPLIPRTWL